MLRPTSEVPDFAKIYDQQLGDVAEILTTSMREATLETKQAWRQQVIAAGLGGRLANTIRSEVYPKARNALSPAGYLYTKAPKIIDAFSRGATIRPANGGRFLWIPTKNVPRRSSRGAGRMSPREVELHFHAKFFFEKGEGRSFLAFMEATRSKNLRTWRQDTKGRRAQGRKAQAVLMFTLVPTVHVLKKLDLQELADAGGASFARGATARLGR